MLDGAAARPLSQSLDLVASEVAELAKLGDRLQGVISRLAATLGAPDPDTLEEAQAADLLSQRLAGLATFVQALAQAAPHDATLDIRAAVNALTLAEQARRLSGPFHALPGEPGDELTTFWD